MDHIIRSIDKETWKGIDIVAYHWEKPSGWPEGSSQTIDMVAFHWSTGPEEAEPLVRLSDVRKLLEKTPEVSNETLSLEQRRALAQRELDEDDMGGGAYG